jgi:hypothetical protein
LRKTVGDRFLNSEFECEFTHSNSFQEIPTNKNYKWNSAWRAGNYIVGAMYLGEFLIFDQKLKTILWTKGYSDTHSGYHDVQVLENGHVLFYQNYGYGKNYAVETSLEEINPITGENIMHQNLYIDGVFNYTPTQGGVVKLNNGHHIFNAVTDKYGAQIFETDVVGNIVFRFTPFPDPYTGIGLHFQQPRVYKLNNFLRNNQNGG